MMRIMTEKFVQTPSVMLTEGDMIVRIRSKESTLSSMILFSTFVYSPYALRLPLSEK